MCDLIFSVRLKEKEGYKVAILKNGKYYSPAMGFQYKRGPVPIVKTQRRISKFFVENILTSAPIRRMKGRTAVFESEDDARELAYNITSYKGGVKPYYVVILKMKITKAIESGYYTNCYSTCRVYAGREILSMRRIAIIY